MKVVLVVLPFPLFLLSARETGMGAACCSPLEGVVTDAAAAQVHYQTRIARCEKNAASAWSKYQEAYNAACALLRLRADDPDGIRLIREADAHSRQHEAHRKKAETLRAEMGEVQDIAISLVVSGGVGALGDNPVDRFYEGVSGLNQYAQRQRKNAAKQPRGKGKYRALQGESSDDEDGGPDQPENGPSGGGGGGGGVAVAAAAPAAQPAQLTEQQQLLYKMAILNSQLENPAAQLGHNPSLPPSAALKMTIARDEQSMKIVAQLSGNDASVAEVERAHRRAQEAEQALKDLDTYQAVTLLPVGEDKKEEEEAPAQAPGAGSEKDDDSLERRFAVFLKV